jgi:hypothetical protein
MTKRCISISMPQIKAKAMKMMEKINCYDEED